MIVSHKHKFIFVKQSKVAGTSIEIALSRYLESGDIATPIGEEDERSWLPQDVFDKGIVAKNSSETRTDGELRKLFDHAPVSLAYRHFGYEIENYRVITAERNPWQRLISLFYWDHRHDVRKLNEAEIRSFFQTFLRSKRAEDAARHYIYHINRVCVADFIIRYEHLQADLSSACQFLGLPDIEDIGQIKTKVNQRPKSKKVGRAEFLFDEASHEHVRNVFAHELSQLGYTDPESDCPPFSPDERRGRVRRQFLKKYRGDPPS